MEGWWATVAKLIVQQQMEGWWWATVAQLMIRQQMEGWSGTGKVDGAATNGRLVGNWQS